MAAIQYTMHERARGVTGHIVGNVYNFDIEMQSYSESTETKKTQHVSLNGLTETVLRGVYTLIQVTIGPYADSDHEQVIEFIDSVAGGETFAFDPFGTVAVPENVLQAVMAAQRIQHRRVTHGTTPLRTASFMLRVQ